MSELRLTSTCRPPPSPPAIPPRWQASCPPRGRSCHPGRVPGSVPRWQGTAGAADARRAPSRRRLRAWRRGTDTAEPPLGVCCCTPEPGWHCQLGPGVSCHASPSAGVSAGLREGLNLPPPPRQPCVASDLGRRAGDSHNTLGAMPAVSGGVKLGSGGAVVGARGTLGGAAVPQPGAGLRRGAVCCCGAV